MLNIWSCRRFTILLCERVLTEKYISDDLQPMREQDTGQRETRGRLVFYKAISHLQTTYIHYGFGIYRAGRLHEDEEGLGFFPVNNIILFKGQKMYCIFIFQHFEGFYIYAFSRRFYPKRLTVHSGYTFIVSRCVPWELNPRPLRC